MACDPTISSEDLLIALDEADVSLRSLYRELADDPDLADDVASRLTALQAKRLDLARRVGLAALTERRAAVLASPSSERRPVLPAAVDAATPIDEAVHSDLAGATVEVAAITPTPVTEEPPAVEVVSVHVAVLAQSVPDVPPPADVEPAAVALPPASAAEIARWKAAARSSGLGAGMTAAPTKATSWTLVLHELMKRVGPPRDLLGSIDVMDEVEALEDVGTGEQFDLWARLPRNTQQVWLSMLVARTRALKELHPAPKERGNRVRVIINRYPLWAKKFAPGHVNGLQIAHGPVHGTWAEDARRDWNTLTDMLGVELAVRAPPAPKKKVKRDEREDVPDEEAEVDPTWRLWPLVRDKRAIIIGGDPREPNRERLERAFHLESLEWPHAEGPRKVDAVVGKIRRGAYDVVLVLTPFASHAMSDAVVDAAKEVGVTWAYVDGYGVNTVRIGLEKFVGGRGARA